jgi:hypothetical protein
MNYPIIPEYKQIKELYIQGMSLNQIKKHLNIGDQVIRKCSLLLKADGINIKKNGQKYVYNETYFDNIDCEEKAYWLGFMYADGNVGNFPKCEVRVGLAYKDKEHLEKFRNLLCPEKPIREYKTILNGKEYPCVKFDIPNKYLVESLINKGCVPRKSLILTFPTLEQVPEYLIHHFIRGYFDGDGCIHQVPNATNLISFTIVGTEKFLNKIHDIFKENISDYTRTKLGHKNKTKDNNHKIYTLNKSGRNCVQEIFNYLYKDATVYLSRKYNTFIEILYQ